MLGVSAQLGGRHMAGSLGAVLVLRLTAHANGSLAVKVFLQNRGQSLALLTIWDDKRSFQPLNTHGCTQNKEK